MNIFPIRDQIVVIKEKEVEKVSGGIIHVSNFSSSKDVEGTVVSVGSGRVTMTGAVAPLEVQPGDRVHFNPSMAKEVQLDGSTFYVFREDALTCVLR